MAINFPSIDSMINPLLLLQIYLSDLTTEPVLYTLNAYYIFSLSIFPFYFSTQHPFLSCINTLTYTHTHSLSLLSKSTLSAVQGLKPWLKPFQCCWLDPPCQAETKMSFRKLDNRPHIHGFLSAIQIFKKALASSHCKT